MRGLKDKRGDSIPLSVIGINYRKADLHTRGLFSFDEGKKRQLLNVLKADGIQSFVLSTCNRTEVYFQSDDTLTVSRHFCQTAGLPFEAYEHLINSYTGDRAKAHLLRVASGLDSQILGDFEIVGQIKRDFQLARDEKATGAVLERWYNMALQISKKVKNETKISSGASSVAFASIEYLRKKGIDLREKNVLVIGTGKIGINTCKNFIKQGSRDKITLANRTDETARELAATLGVKFAPYNSLDTLMKEVDVLVIATGADKPVITREHVEHTGQMVIFDLSVPRNVCTTVDKLDMKEVLDVDQLSKAIRENSEVRKAQVPFAEEIVNSGLKEFNEWLTNRTRMELIVSIKNSLNNLGNNEISALSRSQSGFDKEQAALFSERLINKIVNQFASHLTSEQYAEDDKEVLKQIFQINN